VTGWVTSGAIPNGGATRDATPDAIPMGGASPTNNGAANPNTGRDKDKGGTIPNSPAANSSPTDRKRARSFPR
jgi:hypothetical protein